MNDALLPQNMPADAGVEATGPACCEHLGVRVDHWRHQVSVGTRIVPVTPTEFRLLDCLIRQPGRAFSRAELCAAAIRDAVVLERTIDVHIKALRRKLGLPELIETVRSFGYRFRESLPEVPAPLPSD